MDVNGSLVVIPIFWVACLSGPLIPERDEEKKRSVLVITFGTLISLPLPTPFSFRAGKGPEKGQQRANDNNTAVERFLPPLRNERLRKNGLTLGGVLCAQVWCCF